MSTGGYPLGAQYDPRAPYNQEILPEMEVEVLVSVTLSKTVKIKVSDYSRKTIMDEDGPYDTIDLSDTNLKEAVENQIVLPNNAHKWVIPFDIKYGKTKSDLEGWNVDEMEVIRE